MTTTLDPALQDYFDISRSLIFFDAFPLYQMEIMKSYNIS